MEQPENVFASLMGQARCLGEQAREWAQRNKPTTITGWLAFTAAAGVASAAIAIALIISIILAFGLLICLLGAAFVLGITIGFWLCVSAWIFLAFSAIAASLAAWLVIGQLGLGILRAVYNWYWLPWSPAAAAPKATQGSLDAAPYGGEADAAAGVVAAVAARTAEARQHLQKIHDGRTGRGDGRYPLEPALQLHGINSAHLDAPQRPPSPPVMAAAPLSPSPSPSTSSSYLSPPSTDSMEDLQPPSLATAAPPPILGTLR
ncbi:hypothetical protein Vafri_20589 [Volvox africanus]|uniref:Uncharacterized protein n=1 Tax=Volvox africanus TaxID=51714 RepID=A0A8J4BR43_9CHLO|nr:hypothetical protein Vafri_20589 [Volvox africanus]